MMLVTTTHTSQLIPFLKLTSSGYQNGVIVESTRYNYLVGLGDICVGFEGQWTAVADKGLYYWISIAIKMQLLQIFNNCKYSIESYAIALLHYCNRIWEKSAIMEMQ